MHGDFFSDSGRVDPLDESFIIEGFGFRLG